MFPGSIGALLLLVGAIWIVQGFGLVPTGSFMDENPFWGWMGLGFVVAGGAVFFFRRRRR